MQLPAMLAKAAKVLSVACGAYHTLLRAQESWSSTPVVYAFGCNTDGQLGLGAGELGLLPLTPGWLVARASNGMPHAARPAGSPALPARVPRGEASRGSILILSAVALHECW